MKTVKLTVALSTEVVGALMMMSGAADTSLTEQLRQGISNRHYLRGKRVFVEDRCGCRQEVRLP